MAHAPSPAVGIVSISIPCNVRTARGKGAHWEEERPCGAKLTAQVIRGANSRATGRWMGTGREWLRPT
eukprot:4032701-Pyramimonas_sp.AAC.1